MTSHTYTHEKNLLFTSLVGISEMALWNVTSTVKNNYTASLQAGVLHAVNFRWQSIQYYIDYKGNNEAYIN